MCVIIDTQGLLFSLAADLITHTAHPMRMPRTTTAVRSWYFIPTLGFRLHNTSNIHLKTQPTLPVS